MKSEITIISTQNRHLTRNLQFVEAVLIFGQEGVFFEAYQNFSPGRWVVLLTRHFSSKRKIRYFWQGEKDIRKIKESFVDIREAIKWIGENPNQIIDFASE